MDGTDLLAYLGASPSGQRYIAESPWRMTDSFCNGVLVAFNLNSSSAAMSAVCANVPRRWNGLQQFAQMAGQHGGQSSAAARNNHVLGEHTEGGVYPLNRLVFGTAANVPLSVGNRFLAASVDTVTAFCNLPTHPLVRFALVNGLGSDLSLGATPVDTCLGGTNRSADAIGLMGTSGAVTKTVISAGALLYTGSSVGFRLYNNQTSSAGNDWAIDNPRILDVTPQMDKAFTPASINLGQVSRLTMTMTNTTDLLRKQGWSFTDNLPAGLVVEGNASTTCPGTTVQAAAGGSTVTVSNGDLAQGAAFCEVSLDVRPTATGSFTNGASNLSLIGLNQPASPAVLAVAPAADMQATSITLPLTMTVGAPVSGSFSCTNAGPSEATAASCVISGLPAGATTSCTPSVPTASPLASGGSIACTVQFTPTTTGTIAALVTASSSTVDPVPANNTKAHPFNPVERADMQATSVTLPATANVGVPVKGSFVCTNAGPNAAAFANCSIAGLPADASTSCTPAVPTGTPLASGASISCTVSFTPTTQGSLTATVTAVSGTTDPEPANNSRDQELVVAAALAPEPVPATGVPALVLMGLAVMLAGLGTQRGRVRR